MGPFITYREGGGLQNGRGAESGFNPTKQIVCVGGVGGRGRLKMV